MDSVFPFLSGGLDFSLHAKMVCLILEKKRGISVSVPFRDFTVSQCWLNLNQGGKRTENL
jgi:hypothetical protein